MADVTKVTANLPNSVVADLREIAAANNTTLTEAIRQSITFQKFLLDKERAHAKVLIEAADGRMTQIVRRSAPPLAGASGIDLTVPERDP